MLCFSNRINKVELITIKSQVQWRLPAGICWRSSQANVPWEYTNYSHMVSAVKFSFLSTIRRSWNECACNKCLGEVRNAEIIYLGNHLHCFTVTLLDSESRAFLLKWLWKVISTCSIFYFFNECGHLQAVHKVCFWNCFSENDVITIY